MHRLEPKSLPFAGRRSINLLTALRACILAFLPHYLPSTPLLRLVHLIACLTACWVWYVHMSGCRASGDDALASPFPRNTPQPRRTVRNDQHLCSTDASGTGGTGTTGPANITTSANDATGTAAALPLEVSVEHSDRCEASSYTSPFALLTILRTLYTARCVHRDEASGRLAELSDSSEPSSATLRRTRATHMPRPGSVDEMAPRTPLTREQASPIVRTLRSFTATLNGADFNLLDDEDDDDTPRRPPASLPLPHDAISPPAPLAVLTPAIPSPLRVAFRRATSRASPKASPAAVATTTNSPAVMLLSAVPPPSRSPPAASPPAISVKQASYSSTDANRDSPPIPAPPPPTPNVRVAVQASEYARPHAEEQGSEVEALAGVPAVSHRI